MTKPIMGIVVALIMVGSVAALLMYVTSGSDATQTKIRNGYRVNPDNITISLDGNTTSVVIGQNIQFILGNNKTGTVTVTGVEGTLAEGHVVFSDSTGWLDTTVMVEGIYNATYGAHWELLAVSTSVVNFAFNVDGYEVSSITVGTLLGINFTSNLDENDCVDLRVINPEGVLLCATNNQQFDDINVTQLLEYGSENESKRIHTTGWKIGTYLFSVRTEAENARGLDVSSCTRTLAVCSTEIKIEADKCHVVELEKVCLIVSGAPYHNITMSSSHPLHTVFPAGFDDNPPYDTSGYNDIIDSPDGIKSYVVYFNETGTYTITVTDTTENVDDHIDIAVTETAVPFTVTLAPNAISSGDSFEICGSSPSDYVEIVAIAPNGGNGTGIAGLYGVSINTVPVSAPGSYHIHVFTSRTNSGTRASEDFTSNGAMNPDNGTIIIIEEKIVIEAGTTRPAIKEKVLFTVETAAYKLFNFSTTRPEDVVMTSLEDNPLGLPAGEEVPMNNKTFVADIFGENGTFNATANKNGIFNFTVYFIGNGTYMFRVWYDAGTYADATKRDSIAIDVLEAEAGTFYQRIKVDATADVGNYTIIVLSPGKDAVYGNSSCKYIDSFLDLDGAGPELGVIDVSDMTREEIISSIEDVTINQACSDDLLWRGAILVTQFDLFDTRFGTYPSIMGTHNGTIRPSQNIIVNKMYTYPCTGTGGHSEFIRIYNESGTIAEGYWNGYQNDCYNITIIPSVMLMADHTYNYTIFTDSYPQIIHAKSKDVTGGTITCSSFVDVNGRIYDNYIPAIKLY